MRIVSGGPVKWRNACMQRVVVRVHGVQRHGVRGVGTGARRARSPRRVRVAETRGSGRRVGVVGRDPRGVHVVRESEVHLRVQRIELIQPAVGPHDGGLFVTARRERREMICQSGSSGRENASPQNLVRAHDDRLLTAVSAVLHLQHDVDPDPRVAPRLHAQQEDAGPFLFGLCDESMFGLRFAKVFPVDQVVPGESLNGRARVAQVELAAGRGGEHDYKSVAQGRRSDVGLNFSVRT